MYHNIIAIEGISGIGKSNLAQHISLLLKDKNQQNRWFFELEKNNPVIPDNHDGNIINDSYVKWKNYLKYRDCQSTTDIFDGRILMLNIEFSIREGFSKNEIIIKMQKFIDLINKNNIFVVLLYTSNIDSLFTNAMKSRECLNWYINNLKMSKYNSRNAEINRNTVIEVMSTQQNIMLEIFNDISVNKLLIDITDLDWAKRYIEINEYFQFSTNKTTYDMNEYIGKYVNKNINEKYSLEILDKELVCTIHPYQRFKPMEQVFKLMQLEPDVFVAKGQPIKLIFNRDLDNKIISITENGLFETENYQGILKDIFIKDKR